MTRLEPTSGTTSPSDAPPNPSLPLSEIPPDVSAALAAAWAERGLDARARAARYARFSLELLQLGAPSGYARAAAQAIQNELDHSRCCFEIAQRHGVPSPELASVGGSTDTEADLGAVALRAVRDGCIGATISSIQTREELEHCQDAATREVLARLRQIRADEAQLAWRFLAWTVKRATPELVDRIRAAFLAELGDHRERLTLTDWDRRLLRRGVAPAQQARALRQHVLRTAVIPCMEAALP